MLVVFDIHEVALKFPYRGPTRSLEDHHSASQKPAEARMPFL